MNSWDTMGYYHKKKGRYGSLDRLHQVSAASVENSEAGKFYIRSVVYGNLTGAEGLKRLRAGLSKYPEEHAVKGRVLEEALEFKEETWEGPASVEGCPFHTRILEMCSVIEIDTTGRWLKKTL